MYGFENLTLTKGFDVNNLTNGRQNNYAWAISDLNEHIYVATGRNVLVNMLRATNIFTEMPLSLQPTNQNNFGEVWRYRKYVNEPWQRAFKISKKYEGDAPNLLGFSTMISHRPYGGQSALYAISASVDNSLIIYKTVSGVDWRPVIDCDESGQKIKGNISRAMISKDGKIYLATVNNLYGENEESYLYSSEDPEFYPWKLETYPKNCPKYDINKNPQGGISSMIEFNDRIYVGTSTPYGAQVWRTNGCSPCFNDWTLVACDGFNDKSNRHVTTMGVFKNNLYVGLSKFMPLAFILPMGCEMAKIDKCDNWEIVVGGEYRGPSCKIDDYDICYLDAMRYQFGFDLYTSCNGYKYKLKSCNGIANRCGRRRFAGMSLHEDLEGDLYLGTANVYQGCEVLKYTNAPYTDEERYGEFALGRCYDYDKDMERKVYKLYEELYELLREPLDYVKYNYEEILSKMNKF